MSESGAAPGSCEDPPRGLGILLVSKDALFARIARAKLESWGHSVRIEEDVAAAIQWCRIDPIRLVVVDFDLPERAGERLCRELRTAPRAGYIYLLGYASAADRERSIAALEAGADSYALKPLHPGELRLRLDQAHRLLSLDHALGQGTGADLVTGLLAHGAFERFFSALHAQFLRSGGTGTLMFVEITNIGEILQRQGLTAAESLESEVGRHLAAVPRSSDIVARLGHGRFCLLLTNTTTLKSHVVADRVGQELTALANAGDRGLPRPALVVSMADFPAPGLDASELLEQAPRTVMAVIGGGSGPSSAEMPLPL